MKFGGQIKYFFKYQVQHVSTSAYTTIPLSGESKADANVSLGKSLQKPHSYKQL
jgi:hypothetical protein